MYGPHATLFAEELGLVLEVKASDAQEIASLYSQAGVPALVIGKVGSFYQPRACPLPVSQPEC